MAGDEASTIAEIIEECGGKSELIDGRIKLSTFLSEERNSETLVPLKTINWKENC